VRFHHFGEEAYAETERAIQELLEVDEPLSDVDADGLASPADWVALRSPETYLGRARGTGPSGSGTGDLALNPGRSPAPGPWETSAWCSTRPGARSPSGSRRAT
jgi:hypothetical protein